MDDCGQTNPDGIYILGDFAAGDTDEFDQSVIAHEFGHYFEDRFGRSDSIGGDHGGSATLVDLRVAFGEGWGNAFSGMVLGDPIYRDSQQGMNSDFRSTWNRTIRSTKAGSPKPRSARSCGTCSTPPTSRATPSLSASRRCTR